MKIQLLNLKKAYFLILAALIFSSLLGCLKVYDQFFTLTRDEEVQLYDGRVIVVHFKFTYERLDRREEYSRSILRDTEMTFDAGPPYGKVTQLFKRMQPQLLNQYKGQWYAVLEPRGAGDSPEITGQDWGPMQTGYGQWPIKLMNGKFQPIAVKDFPDEIVKMNLLRDRAPISERPKLNEQIFNLKRKAAYQKKYPLHPEDVFLHKPQNEVVRLKIKGE